MSTLLVPPLTLNAARAAADNGVPPNQNHPLFMVERPNQEPLYVYAQNTQGALAYAADYDGYVVAPASQAHQFTVRTPNGRNLGPHFAAETYVALAWAADCDGYRAKRIAVAWWPPH